jgi:hypothetical protein
MNHTSDLLASPDITAKARSDAETDYMNGADADASLIEDDDAYFNAIAEALNNTHRDHLVQEQKKSTRM